MEFLKRHYEKLILLLLLLAFIGTMMYVLEIIKQTKEVTEESLQLPTRSADYKPKKADDPEFDVSALIASTALDWKSSEARSSGEGSAFPGYYSDLVNVFAIVKCPFCGKVIPRGYMEKEELCPFCANKAGEGKGEKFRKPPKIVIPVGFPRTIEDPTGCGIPVAVKQMFGLNTEIAEDARYDMDGDGFSNVYEYRFGTEMNNPLSYPPLWHRLRAVRVGQKKLGVVFTGVQKLNSDDKAHWLYDLTLDRGRKQNLKLGQSIMVEGLRYVLSDYEVKDGAGVLVLTSNVPKRTLELKENVAPISPDVTADLEDVFTQKKYNNLKVKSTVAMDTPRRRMVRASYRIHAIDPETNAVTLEATAGTKKENPTVDEQGEPMVVTTRGKVPSHMTVKEPEVPQEGEGMMPPSRQPRQVRPGGRPVRYR